MPRKFSIYYNDGSVIHGGGEDDDEVTLTFSRKWLEAPSDGVATIAVERPDTGREMLQSHEYYYQLPINHHGKGAVGQSMKMGAYLRQVGIVKFGGWTDTENHRNIVNRANADKHIRPVSATRRVSQEDTAD